MALRFDEIGVVVWKVLRWLRESSDESCSSQRKLPRRITERDFEERIGFLQQCSQKGLCKPGKEEGMEEVCEDEQVFARCCCGTCGAVGKSLEERNWT